MANTTFSPVIFANELIRKYDQKNVFMRYVNGDYTGELKKAGDKVVVQIAPTLTFTASSISNPGASTFRTGTGPGGVISSEDYVMTTDELVINKYTEKRLIIKNFELVQSNIALDSMLADRAAVGMANLLDSEIRDLILVTDVANIPASNKLYSASPKTDVSKTTIFGYIEEMRVALENQGVTENLVVLMPTQYASFLLQSGLLDNSDSGLAMRKQGILRMISGIDVVPTVALNASGEMIMMQSGTVNFVKQITDSSLKEATDGFYSNLMFQIVWGGTIFTESGKGICIFYATPNS